MSSANENALPRRALVIDNDQATRESTIDLLRQQDFTVTAASDGAEALTVFARDWYPLVIASRDIPTLDGIEISARLRIIALAPVYIIMLTRSTDARDHELGYCAGVDQFLLLQNYQTELANKAEAGMLALRRRRSLRTGRVDEPATVDLENGAHTARHLVGRLHAEIAQAARSEKLLQLCSIGVDTDEDLVFARRSLGTSVSNTLLSAVHDAIRPRLDWVARMPAPSHTCRLAVVMPESAPTDAAAVEQRIRNAFVHWNTESAASELRLTFGLTSITNSDPAPTALEFLGQAERNRRNKDSGKAEAAVKAEAPVKTEAPKTEAPAAAPQEHAA